MQANPPPPSTRPPGTLCQRLLRHFWYWLISSIFGCLDMLLSLVTRNVEVDVERLGKRSNQTVVMTGGSGGIGIAIVKKLLQLDYTVILGDPDVPLCKSKVSELRNQGISSGRVITFPLNLKSLSSVKKFAATVLSSEEGKRIHVLLNHAGIIHPRFEITEDGYESHFQVNYLAHFLLTHELLARIRETATTKWGGDSGGCYIIHTSSFFHLGGNLSFDDLEISQIYSHYKSYSDAKLCLAVHAKTLQNLVRGQNVHVYAANPGTIPTTLWNDAGGLISMSRRFAATFCHTPENGAASILYPMLTLSPVEWRKLGGTYFSQGKPSRHNSQVDNELVQGELWARSLKLLGKHVD